MVQDDKNNRITFYLGDTKHSICYDKKINMRCFDLSFALPYIESGYSILTQSTNCLEKTVYNIFLNPEISEPKARKILEDVSLIKTKSYEIYNFHKINDLKDYNYFAPNKSTSFSFMK